MHKLFSIVVASTFLLGSVVAIADDNDLKPLSKMDAQEAKAARAAAKAKWDAMTPKQQAAAKKAARAKKLSEATWRQPFTHPDGTPLMGDFWSPEGYPWDKAK